MRKPYFLILILLMVSLCQCDPEPFDGGGGPPPPITTGVLEVDFKIPYVPFPASKVHRIDLSLANTADSLYRSLFFSSANVSDQKSLYRFVLKPGTYYYRAGITCSAQGDSCLWGGFPGGQFGVRWAVDQVEIKLGEVIRRSPSFQ